MGKYRVPNHDLFTRPWWSATWRRVAWTALAVTIAVLPGLTATEDALLAGGVTVLLAAAAAFATALVRLPEVTDGAVPLWQAALARVARTVGQVLIAAGLGTAVVLGDVAWADAGRTALIAALVTLLRTAMTALGPVDDLPEVEAAR